MEHLPFAVFALLPLGLASLFSPRLPRATPGFAFLPFLAPLIAKGASMLINRGKNKASEKQAEEARRLETQRADEVARQQWQAEQDSPAARAARFKSTLSLGRLAGKMGGLEKLPPSIRNYYQTMRTMPEYMGTSSYIATPKKGGGVWDFLGGVAEALPYADTSQFGRPKASAPLMAAGNAAAQSNLSLAPGSGGMATSIADLTERLKKGRQG